MRGQGGAIAGALAAVAGWLVEPEPVNEPRLELASMTEVDDRPAVAVVGLARRCGTTTLARALGAELASRDPTGACVLTWGGGAGVLPLGFPAASRLARTLARLTGGRARTCGRLCLLEEAEPAPLVEAVRRVAPLVMDVRDATGAAVAAALAGTVVLCGSPGVEEALAPVVAGSLARVGPEPLVAFNRASPDWAWDAADVAVPESRMGAQLALAGREPRGEMGRAIGELADMVERHA